MMDYQQFSYICSENGIKLDSYQLEQIQNYCDELKFWNERINLISRKDMDKLLERHVLHSISVLRFIKLLPESKCLDIGTGGGLPGIPIAIAMPGVNMLLVDSIFKKINAVVQIVKKLDCRNIACSVNRVEVLGEYIDYQRQFDFVFARAVSTINNIIKWTTKLVKQNSTIIIYKGGDLSEELGIAQKDFQQYSFEEVLINMNGYDAFARDEKKFVICRLCDI